MSRPATSPHHTPQQHGRHHDYEGATEPRGPGEGQQQKPTASAVPPRHNEGVENPPEPESQPDGFGEPDDAEPVTDQDGSTATPRSKRRPARSPAPSEPMR